MNLENNISMDTVTSAFLKYNLGDIKGDPEQIKWDVDLNYKITTEQGQVYLLKYIVNPDHIQKFEFLGTLYEYLNSKNIPVPKLCRTRQGNVVEDSFILYGYIEGSDQRERDDLEVVSLVNNFVKLLLILKEYAVPDFVKYNDDKYIKGYDFTYCHDVFRPKILQLDMPEDIKNSIVETIDILYTKLPDFEKLPKQLVHGDLNEMNAIFKDGVNVGIIDFGLSYDPMIYDLWEFCYRFALPWKTFEFNMPRYHLIIETFEKIFPLSSLEKELLPYMMLRRHMMDTMLALQYYRSHQDTMNVPLGALTEKIRRSHKIMDVINGKLRS